MKNLWFLLLAACLLFSCAKEEVDSSIKEVDSIEKDGKESVTTKTDWLIQFRKDFLEARSKKGVLKKYSDKEIAIGVERLVNVYFGRYIKGEKQSQQVKQYGIKGMDTAAKINFIYDTVTKQVSSHKANYTRDAHLIATDIQIDDKSGELQIYTIIGDGNETPVDYDEECDVFENSPDNCWLVGSGDLDAPGAIPDPNLDTTCNGEITGSNGIEELEDIVNQNLFDINGSDAICESNEAPTYYTDPQCERIFLANPNNNPNNWNVGAPCGTFFNQTLDNFGPTTGLNPQVLNCMYCFFIQDLQDDTPFYIFPSQSIIGDNVIPVSINLATDVAPSQIGRIYADICWGEYECINIDPCNGLPCNNLNEVVITEIELCEIIFC